MILTEIHIWEENKSVITMFVYWLSNTDHFIEIRQLNNFNNVPINFKYHDKKYVNDNIIIKIN